jgi:hypothetical protein
MIDKGFSWMVIWTACMASCHYYNQSLEVSPLETMVEVWQKEVDSTIATMGLSRERTRIFQLHELEVAPSMEISCREEVWSWPCTKGAFQKYVEEELWRHEGNACRTVDLDEVFEVVLNDKGEVTQVFTVMDVEKDEVSCVNEVVQIIEEMPRWQPGMSEGKAVWTRLVLPYRTFTYL